MRENIIQFGDFREGLYISEDPTKAPLGSAQKMVNGSITDRGGISKRKGIKLLGDFNSDSVSCQGFTVLKKTNFVYEIPLIGRSDGTLYYYSPQTEQWELLKDGLGADANFGFTYGFTKTGDIDYIYGGNSFDEDFKWGGITTKVSEDALTGATTLKVTSVLRDEIYGTIDSDDVSSSSATTLQIDSSDWTADQWIGFYVYIKSGTYIGKIRKITDTTADTLTFDTLGGDPGSCDFEIRMMDFSASGTLIVGGEEITYSAIDKYNEITVTALTSDIDEDTAVTLPITLNASGPRGNRMCVLNARRYVANVKSALKLDSSGNLVGTAQPGSVFVSKVVNGLHNDGSLDDFTYSSPRTAGEGDIIAGVLGGAGHIDILPYNDAVYMFKPNAIESVAYSQDIDDLATIGQPAPSFGAASRVIEGAGDLFFITSDKQFTSISLVLETARDQAKNIGLRIKRLLEQYSYERNSKGAIYKNKIYIPAKAKSTDSTTNRVLVFNKDEAMPRFEGEYYLNVDSMATYNNNLYFSSSNSGNVYQIESDELNDIIGSSSSNDKKYPITFEWLSNFHNLTGNNFIRQSVNMFACEGYILGNTKLDFSFYKNLQEMPFMNFSFTGTDDTVESDISSLFLGSLPLGLEPLGAISDEVDNEGRRHFLFYLYFPFEYAESIAWGIKNTGLDQSFEITRAGFNPSVDTVIDISNKIKQL
jgi:hypothetical protein